MYPPNRDVVGQSKGINIFECPNLDLEQIWIILSFVTRNVQNIVTTKMRQKSLSESDIAK